MEMCLFFFLITEPLHNGGMFARQARWEVLAAALGETRKNMMRPIERGRHWFLMRGCRFRGTGPGGQVQHKRGSCVQLREGKCFEK